MAEDESGKKRVNLYLDKDAVERAQALGINLSKVTNEMLEGLPEAGTDTRKAYLELFGKITPILSHYHTCVKIGFGETMEGFEIGDLYLDKDGTFSMFSQEISKKTGLKTLKGVEFGGESPVGTSWKIPDIFSFLEQNFEFILFEPKGIFSNLLRAIADKKEHDKEKVAEIEKVKRIITAIEPDLLEEAQPKKK